jgi:hypothetical protein
MESFAMEQTRCTETDPSSPDHCSAPRQTGYRTRTDTEDDELDTKLAAYRSAVETWIAAIRDEEALAASANQSMAEIDEWEQAHFREDIARQVAREAKFAYESALRESSLAFLSPTSLPHRRRQETSNRIHFLTFDMRSARAWWQTIAYRPRCLVAYNLDRR